KFRLGHFTQSPSPLRDTIAFEAAEKFSSEQPFFKVIVGKQSSVLRLPNDFVKSHIDQKVQTVTLKVGNRSWLVKLLRSSSGYFLSGGFSKFARQTSLSPGDVCIYELTERNQVVLKVSIFRFTVVT
ncbi:B3 DNA binding domain containing protein, partial [Parasponia andersonii]